MIYELRTYTAKPGTIPAILKANEEVARPVRGDNYGKLEGYWYTDIGPVNQVMHLWSFDDLVERERLRAELGALPAWGKEYVPLIRPHLVKQNIRFLNAARDMNPPGDDGNFYEFRNYRLQPGMAGQWIANILKAMPLREKYSRCVAMWTCEAPDPNEVCHLWSYKDLDDRMKARVDSAGDTELVDILKAGRPLIEEQHSTLIWPASFSPLR